MFSYIIKGIIAHYADILVALFYKNNIWRLREVCINKPNQHFKEYLYYSYLRKFGSWIGLGAKISSPLILPHGLHGIFISNEAEIGRDVVIFHQVTIGSNKIKGTKSYGSPSIHDNCYIGCGAKIIGGISIGENVRIGANCIVTRDIPSNSVCVLRGLDVITKNQILENGWIPTYEK